MVFGWLKARRRRKILAEPFPESWEAILRTNVPRYGMLDAARQQKVRDYLRILIAEKYWEGCGGLEVTDEMRVTIAAEVGILTLGLEQEFFTKILSILIYPDAYVAPDKTVNQGGVVVESGSAREGEAWYRGPVILSWSDVLEGAQGHSDGNNLVFHEFAHQLDMLNGRVADGIPPLETDDQVKRWIQICDAEFERLSDDCRHGHGSVLSCYGTTNKAEFFAVATEVFFELPRQLESQHPELYGILREYYRQDPRRWTRK